MYFIRKISQATLAVYLFAALCLPTLGIASDPNVYTYIQNFGNGTLPDVPPEHANYVYTQPGAYLDIVNNPTAIPYISNTNPVAGEQLTIAWKVEFAAISNPANYPYNGGIYPASIDKGVIYYTVDGSNPSGSLGIGNGTTQAVVLDISEAITSVFTDANPNVLSVVFGITLFAGPAGSTFKYIVSSFNTSGDPIYTSLDPTLGLGEIFGNSGSCYYNQAAQFCTPVTDSANATVFTIDVVGVPEPGTYLILCSFLLFGLAVGKFRKRAEIA